MYCEFSFLKRGGILLLCLFLLAFSVSAETTVLDPPVTGTLEGEGSVQDLAIDYGTSQIPVSQASVHNFVYKYEGYSIDPSSSISIVMGDSWFGNDSEVNASYSINHELREISFTLSRIDEDEIGGYGYVVKLKGIIVVVDDIHRFGREEFGFSSYYTPDSETLLLMLDSDYGSVKFTLYGLNGALVARKNHVGGNKFKWNLHGIVPQLYVLEMTDGKRVVRQKMLIGR